MTAAMSWAVSHAMRPLAASCWYVPRRTESRLCDRRGLQPGLEERPLVALHVVGRDVQRVDALGLHVPHEVHQIPAIGLDRVVREQHVAEPGHQRRRWHSWPRCRWQRKPGPGRPRPSRPPGRPPPGSRSARAGAGCGVAPLRHPAAGGPGVWSRRGLHNPSQHNPSRTNIVTNQMVTWPSGKESIFPRCRTKGRDIKHIMSHAPGGRKGQRSRRGKALCPIASRGWEARGGPGNRSKVQNDRQNLDQKGRARAGGLRPHGSPVVSAQQGLAVCVPPR